MKATIFSKTRKTREGKQFLTYFGTIARKDGTAEQVSVKFRQDVEIPKTFPCVINFDKSDANLSTGTYYKETDTPDGDVAVEEIETKTLWITGYTSVEAYVDHSLDDYE